MDEVDPTSNALLDPLTRRETKVLALLIENKTNPEIAAQESLAASSVKWYINQIFSKLGVKTREQAIARAKELRLFEGSASPPRNNLPRELTSFIGREKEIAQVLHLVREHPLVTLTGSGGTGKTRLALKTAEKALLQSRDIFQDGIWLVELAPVAGNELVPHAVINGIGLSDVPGLPPTQVLTGYLHHRQALIVLDNCEHVIEAAARLTYDLLQACPQLHILATSREILGAEGEIPFRVPPLAGPDPLHLPPLDELARFDAVRLFVERAQVVSPDFTIQEDNAPIVTRIARRLDGIPLAIELAAARVRLLTVEQISIRLDSTFRLLTGGSRTDLPRHQTLKALIDWSYNLLSEKERLLLLRLSVFAGGWTLEAAEAVCADAPDRDGLLPAEEILDLLGQLVDKSLAELAPKSRGGSPRYRMLETIRQYAHDRLVESGGGVEVRERHLDYFLSFSLRAEIELRGRHFRAWRERLDDEMDNLRLALEWAETGSVEKGLRLAAALYLYWLSYIGEEEGSIWLERLLAAESSAPERLRIEPGRRAARGKALYTLADIGGFFGLDQTSLAKEATGIFQELGDAYQIDWAISLSLSSMKELDTALTLFRKVGDPFYIGNAMYPLILEAGLTGNLGQCRAYAVELLACHQKSGYLDGEEVGWSILALIELLEGNLPAMQDDINQAQQCAEAAGESGTGYVNIIQGMADLFQGNYAKARRFLQDDLAARREKGFHWIIAELLAALARTAYACRDYDLAEKYAEEALRLPGRISDVALRHDRYVLALTAISRGHFERASAALKDSLLNWSGNGLIIVLPQLVVQAFGILAAAQAARPGQALRAAVLFGAQDFINRNLMNIMTPPERESYHQSLAMVRAALSETDFAHAWAKGKAMNTSQAIDYALSE